VTDTARCAVYARYSSEKQNPLTVDQQIRKCREYADRAGLCVIEQYIFADRAVTGATDERAGLQRLLTCAKEKPRPFDCILIDDTSRLSRRQADSLRIHDELQFLGVRVIFVAQGIDTNSEQAGLLVGVHGIVDELYLKDLAKRTFRGVEQLALQGLHTGGRVFGYRHIPIESATECDSYGRPVIKGVRLEVDPNQAPTIRRIFQRYAAGDSMKRIAIDLNRDGILSPRPRQGRSQSWAQSSVRHILLNERYRGVVIWGKTKKVRSPETGKRIYRHRPLSEWRRVETPEQRIVSDELWSRTHERLKLVQDLYGIREGKRRGRAIASPYLFTGLLECSECGGSITIVSGRCRKRQDSRYGCSMHAQRGDSVCKNSLLVRRLDLERQLLAGLQERVLHPEVVTYTLKRFEEELAKALAAQHQGDIHLRCQAAELEQSIANQLRALCDGYSAAITADLAKREQQLAAVRERLKTSDPQTVKLQMRDTRRFVECRLRNLSALLDGEPQIAREEIAKHVGKITLKPMLRTYIATGVWDWLGVLGDAAAMVVPGARIELATPAFSGRRSTNELPRHACSQNCRGDNRVCQIMASLHGIVEFFHPCAILEQFARLGSVRRANDAVLLHQINQTRRAAITNPQPPLQR
jgi:site-specific DNA recombinase